MINENVLNYIEGLIPKRDEFFSEIEAYAKEHEVPIMEVEGMEALLMLLRIHQPKKILEVGAAIGYSSLRMSDCLPDAKIVTIERDEERATIAMQNIEKMGKTDSITLIIGDALEVDDLVKIHGPFDFIFIDAAKGQYRKFFENYSKFLNEKGIIVTDNVLFKGLVAAPKIENRNVRQLVRKINEFNTWLMTNKTYDSVILPVGDGMAISKKR